MEPSEESLRETFFPEIFGGEEVDTNFCKILFHSVKRGSLCMRDPLLSVESSNSTLNSSCSELVGSLLEVTSLNYVGHREFIHR